MSGTVRIASAHYPHCSVDVRISSLHSDAGVIVCFHMGGATMQTYATREELRAIGELMLRHAESAVEAEVPA